MWSLEKIIEMNNRKELQKSSLSDVPSERLKRALQRVEEAKKDLLRAEEELRKTRSSEQRLS